MNQYHFIPSERLREPVLNGSGATAAVHALAEFPGEADPEPLRKVGRCIRYMMDHLNQPLQVSTLAAQANVSPSHFFALFKRLTGCPPMDYFTRLRMRHACRLLHSTSASVKEVAAELGYDDPFYFSRVFKSVNKVPPSEYRQQLHRYEDSTVTLRSGPAIPAPGENHRSIEEIFRRVSPGMSSSNRETNPVRKVLLSIP